MTTVKYEWVWEPESLLMSQILFSADCLPSLFCPCLIIVGRQLYSTYLDRKSKREAVPTLCLSLSLSLHPCSLFPSVIVIFERLDWRQWQKTEGGAKTGRRVATHVLAASRSLSVFLFGPHPRLPHAPSPLLWFLSWSHAWTLSSSKLTLNLSSLFGSLSLICLHLLLSCSFSPRSLASRSLRRSHSPSLSLVFRQWNICCLNIRPHYLPI